MGSPLAPVLANIFNRIEEHFKKGQQVSYF